MGRICVRLNFPVLAARLRGFYGYAPSLPEMRKWLLAHGYEASGRSWYCDSDSLEHLRAEEIREMVRHEDVGGVTFVEPELLQGDHEGS